MKPILILYATREGHTRRIAEHIAATIRSRGYSADVVDAADLPLNFSMDAYDAAVLAASVHQGKHEEEMVSFVEQFRDGLESMRAIFLSVSLSEAGVEDPAANPEGRARAAADVQRMIDAFLKKTGWHPSKVRAVAGALSYTQYNFLVRFVMKRIAKAQGASTDTTHDHELTDWEALDHIVDEVVPRAPNS
jgi:menaquinone-dependent protoporphyrinogen oxidase